MILDHLSFKFVSKKCQQGVILDHLWCDTGSPKWKLSFGGGETTAGCGWN